MAQNHDYVGLRNFSDYLNVLVAKESNRSLAILDDKNENRILLYKIPDFCLNKWEDIVSSALMNDRGFPSFAEFCKLLRIQSKIKNNPITSVHSGVPPQSPSNAAPRSQGFFQSNYGSRFQQSQGQSSQRRYSNAVSSTPNSGQRPVACFFCNGPHVVTSCDNFSALSLDEKHNFIRSRRLCFGCLRYGHSNRDCQRRLRCSKCDRQHPTLLHDDRKQQSNSQVAPLMPPVQPDRPPRSYFEASMPLRFQHTNQPTSSPSKSTPQQGAKSTTSMNMNVRQMSLSQHISSMIVPVFL